MVFVLRQKNAKTKVVICVLLISTFLWQWIKRYSVVSIKAFSKAPTTLNDDRLAFVRSMMLSAWKAYRLHAWGENELAPLSRTAARNVHDLVSPQMGLTIVDSLDTLWIMNLNEEFDEARDWVKNNFNAKNFAGEISVFEITIRFLAGFLSIYSLTRDTLFLQRAKEVADILTPSFATPSGIPSPKISPKDGKLIFHSCTSLADMGSLHMEFTYLSELTGDQKYASLVNRSRNALIQSGYTVDGLFASTISITNGEACDKTFSIGGGSDSFYEYMLKEFVRSGDQVAFSMYKKALIGIKSKLVGGGRNRKKIMCAGKENEVMNDECYMEHLGCFIGGMLALGSTYNIPEKSEQLELGIQLTKSCHEACRSTPTGLCGEKFRIDQNSEISTVMKQNLLRPEVVESYFILWRVTQNPIYKDWAWEAALAFHKHSFINGSGFSGIVDVDRIPSAYVTTYYDNVQQSFFMAETLKYLYLIFTDPHTTKNYISLEDWVFNTEAHPFPIKKITNAY